MPKMHIKQVDIANQTPGYSPKAWIGVISEMLLVPAAVAGVVTEDITFVTATPANGFRQVYSLPKSHSGASNTVGEEGGLSDTFSHTVFIPGDKAAIQDALKLYMNQPLIILAQDATQDGPVRMYGTLQNPAYMTSKSFESGGMGDGRKGTTVTFFSLNKFDYEGTITEMGV